ncbi:Clp protease N-terminal domain-containing protein [Actinocatenispora rupis]|nr:Clp protease N-terminal domain-containing protein [Actinocatenispora rupis]
MFERFTKEARRAIVIAQEEARTMRHDHIGTGHVLVGILAAEEPGPGMRALLGLGVDPAAVQRYVARLGAEPYDDLDADALATVGIDLDEVRRAAEDAFGPGALDRPRRWQAGHIPFDAMAKKSLELTLRETIRRGDREICDAHVLLGIVRAQPNDATSALRALGVDLTEVRAAVERELDAGQAA